MESFHFISCTLPSLCSLDDKKLDICFFRSSFIQQLLVSSHLSTVTIMSELVTAWRMSPHTFQLSPNTNQDGDTYTCTDCTPDIYFCFVFTAGHKRSRVLTFEQSKDRGVEKYPPAVSLLIHRFFTDWFENPTRFKAIILCESCILSKQPR